MSLFQNSVLNKYLRALDTEKVEVAYNKFTNHFHNLQVQENIRNSKEEQYQGGFLIDLFVNILGYTKNPAPAFNLTTELKNVKDAKKTDGAILDGKQVLAVIELKGTNTTDLSKVEAQAFGYKNNQPGCNYVITSNFEKIRFYIDNAVDFEEFNLFQMTKERFDVFWLCLSADYLLKDLPKKIKSESLTQEENITEQLYKDYSAFRNDVFNSIQTANPQYDKLTLFKKTQKLLDRFLFIFFAEDRLLLPPNSIRSIVNQWKDLRDKYDEYFPLYDRFLKFFGYMNTGHKGHHHDIFAYNGGLFAPDEILDNIKIDDDILHKHTVNLSNYNYESEVDVNILGHIFEHSLNEIESIQSEIKGEAIDKSKTRRKKDGVFYTPKYITKYIVKNTVGKLCDEKKLALNIQEEEYEKERKGRRKDTLKQLLQQLEDYREWLLQITICDPACGSGAFLNQALEYLIAEHRYIDELQAKLLGDSMILSEVENSILENNLYGVDINEESVEIAKLSLWLRTAQKGRALTSLNDNIKCGNSLIDDPEVAGDKAFNWQEEFPDIFAKGGFDVVVGNPPYVGEKGYSDIFESLKKVPKWLEFYRRRSNTYYFFIKQGVELLKSNGIQSLIIPREFVSADWANKVRASILNESTIISIVDFNDLKVFEDAGTTSLILTQQKCKSKFPYNFELKSLRDCLLTVAQLFDRSLYEQYSTSKLDTINYNSWNFYQESVDFNEIICPLSKYFDISQGLVTGADKVTNKHIVNKLIDEVYLGRGIFILQNDIDIINKNNTVQLNIAGHWVTLDTKEVSYIKPFIKTENLHKWFVSESDYYVIYIGSNELEGQIKNYLKQFEGVLLNRSTTVSEGEIITLEDFDNYSIDDIKLKYSSAGAVQKIMRRKLWWLPLYERANVPFDYAKIIVNTKNMDKFTFSNTAHFSSGGGSGGQNFIYLKNEQIPNIEKFTNKTDFTKFTNALLNSSFIQKHISDGQYNQLSTKKIGDLPIIEIDVNDKKLIASYKFVVEKANSIISTSKSINEKQMKVANFIEAKHNVSILNWSDLEFADFLKEFQKAKVKLTLSEEAEWMLYFNEQKEKAQNLKAEIDKINREIDQLVYQLYGLTEDEIRIVEEASA